MPQNEQRADEIKFFNRASGMKATNVQAAIEEVAAGNSKVELLRQIKDVGSGRIMTDSERAKLTAIERGASADQDASEVPYSGDVMADTVKDAIDKLAKKAKGLEFRAHGHQNASILAAILNSGSGNVITKAEREALHKHENSAVLDEISSVGSGAIITTRERNKLDGIERNATKDQDATEVPLHHEELGHTNVAAAIDILYDKIAEALTREGHTHLNAGLLDALRSIGSGEVITAEERRKLETIEAGATKDQAATEVPYHPGRSGLEAVDVQAALDILAEMRKKDRLLAHGHDNLDILKEITASDLITEAERVKLDSVEPGACIQSAADVQYDPYRVSRPHGSTTTPYNIQEALDYWGHDHCNHQILEDVADVGSGRIITDAERQALVDLGAKMGAAVQASRDAINVFEHRVCGVEENSHGHGNLDDLDEIRDAGSGCVITDAERRKLKEIEPGATADQAAREVPYDGSHSKVGAKDVQAAIDNLAGAVHGLYENTHYHENAERLNRITGAGSGEIISREERQKLKGIEPGAKADQNASEVPSAGGSTVQQDLDYLRDRYDSVNVLNHQHDNQGQLNKIESAGSGRIIGHAEREKLLSMHMPTATEVEYDGDHVPAANVADAIEVVGLRARIASELSHSHPNEDALSGVQSSGSGHVITGEERDKLKSVEHGAKNQTAKTTPYDASSSRLKAKDVQRAIDELALRGVHVHGNAEALSKIHHPGSGDIITADERRKLASIQGGANKITSGSQIMHDGEHTISECITMLCGDMDELAEDSHGHKNTAELDRIHNAGSGFIISVQERDKLAGIEEGAVAARDASQIKCGPNSTVKEVLDKHMANLSSLRGFKHEHKNAKVLNGILSLGSASIITAEEREKLAGIEPGANATKHAWEILYEGKQTVQDALEVFREELRKAQERCHIHPNAQALGGIKRSGSGEVITATERTKLAGIEPFAKRIESGKDVPVQIPGITATNVSDALVELLQMIHQVGGLAHGHRRFDVLEAITNAGSGAVMTDKERDKLAEIEYNATGDQDGTEVIYDNASSGLTATTVQNAIDELARR